MKAVSGALLSLFLSSAALAAPPTPTARDREAGAYQLSPEQYRDAIEYSRARYRLHFVGFAWGAAVLALVLGLRVSPRYRDLAERVSRNRFVQALVFVPLLLLTTYLASLPLDAYRHYLARVYRQSVQGFGSWMWDWTKGVLVTLVVAVPVAAALYGILRRSPRRWWLLFWLGSLPVIVFLVFVSPFVVEPLFFDFEPLSARAPNLVPDIERVTHRGGLEIPRERMFWMRASEKLNSLNAYVSGLGPSKRVVVWDTTLARMTEPQTLFVYGHEMGHYVLGHVFKTIAFIAGLLLVLLLLTNVIVRRIFRDGAHPFGIRALADWASLPLLLLFLAVLGEISLPLVNAYSRAQEHAADVYGLEVIHGIVPDSNRAAAEAFQVLGEVNLADPDPPELVRVWLYSHPPIAERIAFARAYDPTATPRYVRPNAAR